MISSKHITKIAVIFVVIAFIGCVVASMFPDFLSSVSKDAGGQDMEYEEKLFYKDDIIDINIVIEDSDWQNMVDNASAEEYYRCNVVVNGTLFESVGIRPKGNSSRSMVTSSGSERYSFRVKFDEYIDGQNCFGLDTLILNNSFNDDSQMREAITYDMFNYLGADSSLYNYAKISLNGEYFGVYLALECVEESFAMRNYGSDYGELYKPDMVGKQDKNGAKGNDNENKGFGGGMPDMKNFEKPTDDGENAKAPQKEATEENQNRNKGGFPGGFGGGGGNEDLAMSLNYIDDNLESYEEIWSASKFASTDADKARVVTALKNISAGTNLEEYMNVDNVLKYMAVQTFVRNLDGLTGTVAHNYYLYEEHGKLNLVPWDYNESFKFDDVSSLVNFPIDTPFTTDDLDTRRFFMVLIENDEYREKYHNYLRILTDEYVFGGAFDEVYTRIRNQIDALVETDPTSLCTYEEYTENADALYEVIRLRAESVNAQIDGNVPSTKEGQAENPNVLIDTSHLDIPQGGRGMGNFGGFTGGNNRNNTEYDTEKQVVSENITN